MVHTEDLNKKPDALDPTILCPFLAKYALHAARDFINMLERREKAKTDHHEEACTANTWDFAAAVITTLGSIGASTFWKILDKAFGKARREEIRRGGTGMDTDRRRDQAMCRLQNIIVRNGELSSTRLAYPPNYAPVANPRAAHLIETRANQAMPHRGDD